MSACLFSVFCFARCNISSFKIKSLKTQNRASLFRGFCGVCCCCCNYIYVQVVSLGAVQLLLILFVCFKFSLCQDTNFILPGSRQIPGSLESWALCFNYSQNAYFRWCSFSVCGYARQLNFAGLQKVLSIHLVKVSNFPGGQIEIFFA